MWERRIVRCGRPVGPLEIWGAYIAFGPGSGTECSPPPRLVPSGSVKSRGLFVNWVLPAVARLTRLCCVLLASLHSSYAVSKVGSRSGSEDAEAAGCGVFDTRESRPRGLQDSEGSTLSLEDFRGVEDAGVPWRGIARTTLVSERGVWDALQWWS